MAIREILYRDFNYKISYDIINPSSQKVIIFLHGWGSNKELMEQAFSRYLNSYKHIYIDMPGFGKSENSNFLTTQDYANIIELFLKELNITPNIILGHSFGGKVATLLNPPCLILVASAGIKVPKSISVKFKIALFQLLKPLKLQKLRNIFVSDDAKDMSEGMYQTFKYVVNEEFEENFSKVTSKTLLFWGKGDSATPLWTAKKIAQMIDNSELFVYEGDHYFFLNHSLDIAKKIEQYCKD